MVRWLRREATEAVLEFPEDTPVGCRSSGMARAVRGETESIRQDSGGDEEGPGPP